MFNRRPNTLLVNWAEQTSRDGAKMIRLPLISLTLALITPTMAHEPQPYEVPALWAHIEECRPSYYEQFNNEAMSDPAYQAARCLGAKIAFFQRQTGILIKLSVLTEAELAQIRIQLERANSLQWAVIQKRDLGDWRYAAAHWLLDELMRDFLKLADRMPW